MSLFSIIEDIEHIKLSDIKLVNTTQVKIADLIDYLEDIDYYYVIISYDYYYKDMCNRVLNVEAYENSKIKVNIYYRSKFPVALAWYYKN